MLAYAAGLSVPDRPPAPPGEPAGPPWMALQGGTGATQAPPVGGAAVPAGPGDPA